MSATDLMQLARSTAQRSQKAGAHDARVQLTRSREIRVEWRDGKLDRIRESTRQNLRLSLFVDGRYSSHTTSDLRNGALGDFIASTVAMTRFLARDEHRRLPNPKRYQGMTRADLGIKDTQTEIPGAKRRRLAAALEDAARSGARDDEIISVSSWVSDNVSQGVCVNTNGLEAHEEATGYSRGVSVSVRDNGDRRPSGWSYGWTKFREDLPEVGDLGRDALQRARAQVGSRQAPTGHYELIVESRAAPRLARYLFAALSGAALQQRRSFLEGKLGELVGSPALDVIDDPHLVRGVASTAYDGEGMATVRRPVFQQGALRTFFYDTYYASKQGVKPTSGGPSNLVWSPGTRDANAMAGAVNRGILVTDFLGGNSNSTTGDFSLGIKGYCIEKGRILHPVSEMNMAGNHLGLWKSLVEIGNDPWTSSSNRTPSLRFDNVQCSGS